MVSRLCQYLLVILTVALLVLNPSYAADPGESESADTEPISTPGDLDSGLREVLRIAAKSVIHRLERRNGYNSNPDVHIPLPKDLGYVHAALFSLGMGRLVEDVELKLNRAAELTAPQMGEQFENAIAEIPLSDAQSLYDGPKDALTRHLRATMERSLAASIHPAMDDSLKESGAIKAYQVMMTEYSNLPWVPDVHADITSHTVDKSIAGVFLLLGREEGAIRDNAEKRTTDRLKRLFGRGP